ncbi:pyrimidine 5'-nucleotidase [Pollutimonas bauzanensis]|uniref:Putative hydrolase of the HAD superfamily n=1 Tax=Pollutimonas bauzanensis TaxID=658167 RepID=A0A1M5RCY2_9BURK|nr:pyrimidine 5'-nucleotidase [Pollutimonas bauzanensis]SHH24154.1 putative hydrolase of the HAD superfamily [Pollutimonas bauzanensis]
MRPLRTTLASHRPRRLAGLAGLEQTVWLFDLDNTLHDCSKAIFKAIDGAMAGAVATTLDIDMDAANALRQTYWKRYGATVIGMVRHHGVDANAFLELSHGFEVAPLVHSENGLGRKLQLLRGRKILLTNAPLKYAREVLKTLGILHHFEGLWAIDHMTLQGQMRPKPSAALMKQVLARLRVPASQVVLVEDTLRNLKSARQAGMRTVHIFHPGTPFTSLNNGRCHYVDVRVNSVGKLLSGRHGLGHRGRRTPGKPGRG